VAADLSDRIQDCVVETGGLLRCAEALLVGLYVSEVEGIVGAKAAVDQFKARFEQEFDSLAGTELKVMLTLGANVEIGLELRLVKDRPATEALGPQASVRTFLSPFGPSPPGFDS